MDDLKGLRAVRSHWQRPAGEQLEGPRQHLEAEIREARTHPTRGRWLSGWRKEPRRAVWIPAVAGIVVVALAFGVGFLRESGTFTGAAEGPQVLDEAAETLEASAGDPIAMPRSDDWLYRKTMQWDVTGEPHTYEVEEWLRADYGLLARYNDAGELETTDGDGTLGDSAMFEDLQDVYSFYQQLPADPEEALQVIYDEVEAGELGPPMACETPDDCADAAEEPWVVDRAAFDLINHLLYVGAPPADLQATLYRALALVPGVQDEGVVTDITGEEAVAIGWNSPSDDVDERLARRSGQILLDPESHTYRGSQWFDDYLWTDNKLLESTIMQSAGIVDEAGDRP